MQSDYRFKDVQYNPVQHTTKQLFGYNQDSRFKIQCITSLQSNNRHPYHVVKSDWCAHSGVSKRNITTRDAYPFMIPFNSLRPSDAYMW